MDFTVGYLYSTSSGKWLLNIYLKIILAWKSFEYFYFLKSIFSSFQIDGSKLGFRDKMQLFAEQIGEKTLKNRHKASTIQREIEQTMDDF